MTASQPLFLALIGAALIVPAVSQSRARQGIEKLNRKEALACRSMDHVLSESLWARDGVDLIQGLKPMVGRPVIAKWLAGLQSQMRGARVQSCAIAWRSLKIQGRWAYEWGITRQKIALPAPRQPIVSRGKMLLILRQNRKGVWKIELESWNSSPA